MRFNDYLFKHFRQAHNQSKHRYWVKHSQLTNVFIQFLDRLALAVTWPSCYVYQLTATHRAKKCVPRTPVVQEQQADLQKWTDGAVIELFRIIILRVLYMYVYVLCLPA